MFLNYSKYHLTVLKAHMNREINITAAPALNSEAETIKNGFENSISDLNFRAKNIP